MPQNTAKLGAPSFTIPTWATGNYSSGAAPGAAKRLAPTYDGFPIGKIAAQHVNDVIGVGRDLDQNLKVYGDTVAQFAALARYERWQVETAIGELGGQPCGDETKNRMFGSTFVNATFTNNLNQIYGGSGHFVGSLGLPPISSGTVSTIASDLGSNGGNGVVIVGYTGSATTTSPFILYTEIGAQISTGSLAIAGTAIASFKIPGQAAFLQFVSNQANAAQRGGQYSATSTDAVYVYRVQSTFTTAAQFDANRTLIPLPSTLRPANRRIKIRCAADPTGNTILVVFSWSDNSASLPYELNGNGCYAMRSTDSGATWSPVTLPASAYGAFNGADHTLVSGPIYDPNFGFVLVWQRWNETAGVTWQLWASPTGGTGAWAMQRSKTFLGPTRPFFQDLVRTPEGLWVAACTGQRLSDSTANANRVDRSILACLPPVNSSFNRNLDQWQFLQGIRGGSGTDRTSGGLFACSNHIAFVNAGAGTVESMYTVPRFGGDYLDV